MWSHYRWAKMIPLSTFHPLIWNRKKLQKSADTTTFLSKCKAKIWKQVKLCQNRFKQRKPMATVEEMDFSFAEFSDKDDDKEEEWQESKKEKNMVSSKEKTEEKEWQESKKKINMVSRKELLLMTTIIIVWISFCLSYAICWVRFSIHVHLFRWFYCCTNEGTPPPLHHVNFNFVFQLLLA